jgi:hypothetical protein
LDFHNQGIKKMLYEKCDKGKRDTLIEFACGMAGDLPRWYDCGYQFVMGIDLSRDNITNPVSGAYARLLRDKKKKENEQWKQHGQKVYYNLDAVFIVGDCALPIGSQTPNKDVDDESLKMVQILYNTRANIRIPEHVPKKLIGKASRGFAMASCMFAVHYFFKSEESLNGFFTNVSSSLRRGGLFIATFMDGIQVDALVSASPNGIKEGRKLHKDSSSEEEGAVPVWAIVKRYNGFDKVDCWRKHIDVFLENTNKLIPEFLVHFETLVEKAAVHGLTCVEDGMFNQRFVELMTQAKSKSAKERTHAEEAVLHLENDKVQQHFSFLNRWVVFRKD